MSKHTPGPLRIVGPSPGGRPDDDGGDYAIIDKDNELIAETYHHVNYGETRPARANAKLFAAAPLMYEALKEMYAAWEGYEMLAALDIAIQRKAEAALAAAGDTE